MPIYFHLSKLSQANTERTVIWVCVGVIALSIVHWGYCQTIRQVRDRYDNTNYNSVGDIQAFTSLFTALIAYFAITGVVQTLTSLAAILLSYSLFGQRYNQRWAVALLILLVLTLMFNFGAAVITSMHADFFTKYAYLPFYYDGYEFELFSKFKVFNAYSIVEAVLSFVVTIPLVSFILFTTLAVSPAKQVI